MVLSASLLGLGASTLRFFIFIITEDTPQKRGLLRTPCEKPTKGWTIKHIGSSQHYEPAPPRRLA